MMKINTIFHRSSHHAKNSGYNFLSKFLVSRSIPSKKSLLPYRLAKLISKFNNQSFGIYDSTSVYKDIELFKLIWFSRNNSRVVHYLHAERDVRHALNYYANRPEITFIATFHKPPKVLKEEIKNTYYLKKLNGAIAVGTNQVGFLKKWLGISNVVYIPHGVDTSFFKPRIYESKTPIILFVGQHLRDFHSFNKVANLFCLQNRDVIFKVVIRKEFVKFIDKNPLVEVLSGIDDQSLLLLYQKASLLFLPLLDSTACNTLLEAMSCGLPIVTTNVGGNAEYLSGTSNFLVPNGDVDYMIDSIIEILQNEKLQIKMKRMSRQKALSYDWKMVAKEVYEFYVALTK